MISTSCPCVLVPTVVFFSRADSPKPPGRLANGAKPAILLDLTNGDCASVLFNLMILVGR